MKSRQAARVKNRSISRIATRNQKRSSNDDYFFVICSRFQIDSVFLLPPIHFLLLSSGKSHQVLLFDSSNSKLTSRASWVTFDQFLKVVHILRDSWSLQSSSHRTQKRLDEELDRKAWSRWHFWQIDNAKDRHFQVGSKFSWERWWRMEEELTSFRLGIGIEESKLEESKLDESKLDEV